MTDAIGNYTPLRTHSHPDEEKTSCEHKQAKAGSTPKPVSPQLAAWQRMEDMYNAGNDGGACMLEPMSYAPERAETSVKPSRPNPPETYEQCVNRATRDASVVGRWAVAAAGCAGGAATVVPAGPVGMAGMCMVGGVGGYYAGGDAGAAIGSADAKVDCDRPDKPGSPTERAIRESIASPAEHGPIKG